MSTITKWGEPSRRKDGHVGATLAVSVRGESGCDGHYAIDTHGLTSDQVADKVVAIGTFHAERSGRMDGFRAIQATPILIGDSTYHVVDIAIRYPTDAAYCSLYLDVRQIAGDAKFKVPGFPRRILYRTPAEIPSDEYIVVTMITAAIPVETEDLAALHEVFTNKVAEKIDAKMSSKGGG